MAEDFLPELLREMPVNADRRVARQLAKGGPGLVLEEIGRTKNSYAKGASRALHPVKLEPQMLSRSVQQGPRVPRLRPGRDLDRGGEAPGDRWRAPIS